MRPGPGLVVMALAFISGARRASTSSSSSGSSSSSLLPTTATARATATGLTGIPTPTATTATATTIPPAITTTATLSARAATLPSTYDSTSGSESFNFNAGGGLTFLLPQFRDGSPGDGGRSHSSDTAGHSRHNSHSRSYAEDRAALNFDFYRRPTLHAPPGNDDEPPLASSTRRARSVDEATRQAGGHDDNSGLPVQYASSRAVDEDAETDAEADVVADEDIFALVAEDDLLSEESFDRLIKLSEDAETAAADEEDYSVALTQPLSKSPEQEQEPESEPEAESQQQDESRLVDESVLHAQHNERQQHEQDERSSSNNNNNNKRETGEERSSGNDAYASHLIAIGQRDGGGTAAAAVATPASPTTAATATAPVVDLKKSILGTATAITRLNPWISACDLAQPGTTGTDLQGQCSAGTLPMAWVDEGPGPPICPRSCAEQQPTDSSASHGDSSKLKYFRNANAMNYKTRFSSSNNNKAMSRVRRERDWQMEAATEMSSATTTEREQELELDLDELEASTLTTASGTSEADALDEQSMPTLLYSHLQTHEQHSANDDGYGEQGQGQGQEQEQEQQQQQQQCLDYLGDAAETSPQHLCGLRSPGQLLGRLRTLRLRHCCERSVFSALHTLALNATLTDRDECVRLLSDLLEVDALANRITCELSEILFRFDCRQVYSLINQCDDCKEAYRRWVCSTLVPYFAEPQDVAAAPPPTTKPPTPAQAQAQAQPTAATPADDLASRGPMAAGVKSKRAARSAGAAAAAATVVVVGSDGINGGKHKSQKLISNNNKSNNGNNMNERQINQQHDENKASTTATATAATTTAAANPPQSESERESESVAQVFYNVVGIGQHQSPAQAEAQSQDGQRKDKRERERERKREREREREQQFNNFISTANNADPSAADPVISKLQKRSTRKAEFRKRRRIRPCLSVCQTVEQKCPYLLPADRAPALPTQYAGEPTFVCLDQNIPETGEQLKKSSYGPNDCCYSYCNGPTAGICTICQDFAVPASNSNSHANGDVDAGEHRVHNITLTMSSPAGEHARAASIAVALRNVSQDEKSTGGGTLLDRLPYYARHDSVYYYDDGDDEGSLMPEMALSDGCAAVPSVSSRCEIPYYASGVAPTPPTQLLVWLSALLGLLSSCGAARQRCARSRTPGRVDCAASCHELLASSLSSTERERKREREREHGDSARRWVWVWVCVWMWMWPAHTYKVMCRKVRYFRGGSRSKLKRETRSRDSRIINYRDLQQLIRIKCSDRNRNARNYRYFYYYNYNINDWWRRWKWFVQGTIAIGAL
ncbi:hypothetical protein KR093_008076 [Drosophila rubida]|uniref:Uncharacterized protein n=1 Tax=Drosophila rubida TaxID=30044 RepID=A0AAD4PKC7_9MUSC|nr:hypothetical protein KR093_008076 [Drosophila rubida]